MSAEHWRVTRRVDAVTKALGRRIRELRTTKGWSQERLADESGMHRTYMWGIEQGVRNPSVRHLTRLADALGVPLRTFFEGL
jgi:transcriptional regulator with XRE-family HTH domain